MIHIMLSAIRNANRLSSCGLNVVKMKRLISGNVHWNESPILGILPPERISKTHRATFATDSKAPILMDIIKRIKMDLKEADVNHDGRIDFEELKLILAKYPNVFSKDDVETIGELFYVGKGGKSVSHATFMRGMLHTVNSDESDESNPLQLENCEDNRCYVSSSHTDVSPFYNTQQEFDKHLLKYIQEIIGKQS